MNIVIFDTETTNLEKPFCYNIGYTIVNATTREILCKKDYVCEQVWHNIPLFSTAYYAEKRLVYVAAMRAKKTILKKYGFIMRDMARDFKNFEVKKAYAFNAPFDDKVFTFNCDFFKVNNPFENIPIIDILPIAQKFVGFTTDYKNFCECHSLFTEGGNYSCNAENLTKYITGNIDFTEDHTALSDSLIEKDILFYCEDKGANIFQSYKKYVSIPRKMKKTLTIKQITDKTSTITEFDYISMKFYKSKDLIILK